MKNQGRNSEYLFFFTTIIFFKRIPFVIQINTWRKNKTDRLFIVYYNFSEKMLIRQNLYGRLNETRPAAWQKKLRNRLFLNITAATRIISIFSLNRFSFIKIFT